MSAARLMRRVLALNGGRCEVSSAHDQDNPTNLAVPPVLDYRLLVTLVDALRSMR